jgi:hypothetical protein
MILSRGTKYDEQENRRQLIQQKDTHIMTNYPLNIFDAYGHVSNSLSEAEIARCSPEQQAILFPLLAAWSDTQEEDIRCNEVEANRRKAVTALDRAEKVLLSVTPLHTFHDEWLRTVSKQPVPEPDPAVTKKIKSAQKVRDAAQEFLAECIAAVLPAQALRDQRRRDFTTLLRTWAANDGRPKNVGDLVHDRIATETAQKLANIAAGMDPNYAAHSASTVGPSHLDRMRSGMGKGGSADYGHNPNKMRGAQLKVQSER